MVIVICIAYNGVSSSAKTLKAEYFMLDNGMEVVLIPNHRAPVVVHMVWYRVGSADDPVGKSGLAHYLEHLMFKGTKRIKPGEFSQIVARNGGQENAFTSRDYTGYFQRVARDRLEIVMELEAERMQGLILSEEITLPERDVILEERSTRVDNEPASLLSEQMAAVQFLRHPYGTPVIGWRNEMEKLTHKDALNFYRQYYSPDNAILVVAGDISFSDLKPLAERYYGGLKPTKLMTRERPIEPPQISPKEITLVDKRVPNVSVTRSYLVPVAEEFTTNDKAALQIIAELLGNKTTSRIYQSLVVKDKLAAAAGASYQPITLNPNRFFIYAEALNGVNANSLTLALDNVISEFLHNGATETEIEEVKIRIQDSTTYALDNPQATAYIFGHALSAGMTVHEVEKWSDIIASISSKRLMTIARKVFRPERSVTGYLLPAGME